MKRERNLANSDEMHHFFEVMQTAALQVRINCKRHAVNVWQIVDPRYDSLALAPHAAPQCSKIKIHFTVA
jgi:hypothetical protein